MYGTHIITLIVRVGYFNNIITVIEDRVAGMCICDTVDTSAQCGYPQTSPFVLLDVVDIIRTY